jgi:hypothetical protein
VTPVFRGRGSIHETGDPIRMVLDDDTVERLRLNAARYGIEVEELMVALLQISSSRVDELLGGPARRP